MITGHLALRGNMDYPKVIQGGMGVAVSDWKLARAVSKTGQLGVVSGTAIDNVLARRLQLGDPGGDVRRALAHFPDQTAAAKIIDAYYIEGGKGADTPFETLPKFSITPSKQLLLMNIAGNFVEVFLAKEGLQNPVGINFMRKIDMALLSGLYGAMLAGVDYVMVGAGIPAEVPPAIEAFSKNQPAALKIYPSNSKTNFEYHFDPSQILTNLPSELKKPLFYPIIATDVLAAHLMRRPLGAIDGFIVEGPEAAGHNAPPRGAAKLSEDGQPVYGDKDRANLEKVASYGLPFWLAGGYGNKKGLQEALQLGAKGIQAGTIFAFCSDSGLSPSLRLSIINAVKGRNIKIFTDPKASPTGFPFKIVRHPGTLSDAERYGARKRICDLGYLRSPYVDEKGELVFLCEAAPDAAQENEGCMCLCNSMFANAGIAQVRNNGYRELPLVTAGEAINEIADIIKSDSIYTAEDAVDYILNRA